MLPCSPVTRTSCPTQLLWCASGSPSLRTRARLCACRPPGERPPAGRMGAPSRMIVMIFYNTVTYPHVRPCRCLIVRAKPKNGVHCTQYALVAGLRPSSPSKASSSSRTRRVPWLFSPNKHPDSRCMAGWYKSVRQLRALRFICRSPLESGYLP